MTMDQPHDDSARDARCLRANGAAHIGVPHPQPGQPCSVCDPGAYREWRKAQVKCSNCGGPLVDDRDYSMGTCKPCRVTEGM